MRFVVGNVFYSFQQTHGRVFVGQDEYAKVNHAEVVVANARQPSNPHKIEPFESFETVGRSEEISEELSRRAKTEMRQTWVGVLENLYFGLEDEFNSFECFLSHCDSL